MTKFTLHIETEDAAVVERIGRAMNGAKVETYEDAAKQYDGVEYEQATPGHNPAADPAKVEVSYWKGPERVSAGNGSGGNWGAEQAFTQGADPAPTATEQGNSGSDTDTAAPPAADQDSTQSHGSPELDADGLPWDERIHASTKTKKQDGCWKSKRGVNLETVKQVEAELRGVMGQDEPAPTPPPVAPPAPPAPEPVADSDAPTDFMGVVQAAGRHGWTPDQIGAALQQCNPPLPSFQQLANRPDLIPQFWAAINGG